MNRKRASGPTQIAGLWKILCALAILSGHVLVTLDATVPEAAPWSESLKVLTFFGSRHFFFFSGFLAASGLVALARPMGSLLGMRFVRLYVLVVASVTLGVLTRLGLGHSGIPDVDQPWPCGLWQGDISWASAIHHLLPTGLVATNDFNYAIWYLYHELRLLLLFPLFRWSLSAGWGRLAGTLVGVLGVATVGENLFHASFPLFRTSPFQTLGYGFIFLAGAATWRILEAVRAEDRAPSQGTAILLLVGGIGIGYLEAFGIRPPFDSPPLLNVQTVVGQTAVFLGLCWLLPRFTMPSWLQTVSLWSVGIYVVHPPIHQFLTHLAAHLGDYRLLALVPTLSIPLGGLFYHGFVEPVARFIKSRAGASG